MHSYRSYAFALVLAAVGLASFHSAARAADAPVPSSDHALLMQLATRLDADDTKIAADHAAIANLQARLAAAQASPAASSTTYGPFTVTGKDVYLTGYNLHIQSGSGSTTATPNGYGNVIIGYNEAPSSPKRTGSHNLILGTDNNYSSYGGIVGGYYNTISAGYASVLGGRRATASGMYSTVSGGYGGAASGQYAAITGGYNDVASGEYSSVVGGSGNAAGGEYSAIIGGYSDTTSYSYSTITGNGGISDTGEDDVEPESSAYVSLSNSINSVNTTVQQQGSVTGLFKLSNGVGTNTELTLSGVNLHIINGLGATNGEPGNPQDTANTKTNGLGNLIIGYDTTRASLGGNNSDSRGGSHNLILGDYNEYSSYGGMIGGYFDEIDGAYDGILGGQLNTANGSYSSISGGLDSTASGSCSSVSGGSGNTASGPGSSVSGGGLDTASGSYSSVSGGESINESTQFGWAAGNQGNTSYSGNFTSP